RVCRHNSSFLWPLQLPLVSCLEPYSFSYSIPLQLYTGMVTDDLFTASKTVNELNVLKMLNPLFATKRMHPILNKIAFLFAFVVFTTWGQESLSAKQAVFTALENNYQVSISEKQLEIAETNNSWAGAGAFPSVTLGIGNNNTIQDNTNNP